MLKLLSRYTFLILLCVTCVSCVEEYSVDQAIQKYTALNLKMPEAENDGRVQTLNRKGAMSPQFDEATTKFMEFAKGKKVLEVGGAYGKVMIEVLKECPDTTYHLSDLDERHLFIAAHTAKSQGLQDIALQNVKFIRLDITAALQATNKYDAILVARVLHFLSPSQLETAMGNLFNMLRPGGRAYVVAITPYVKRYESFIPEYENRLSRQVPYPGYVRSLQDWINKEVTSAAQLAVISEEPFMFLDDKVLPKMFQRAGFKVLDCRHVGLGYPSSSWSLDGRENVILIAEKPN